MNAFMKKHNKNIIGILTGWDRIDMVFPVAQPMGKTVLD